MRLAWQAWNEENLGEAEKGLIKRFQPLLNNTEVETPAVIPSEIVLRDFLKNFSRRLIIFGMEPKAPDTLLKVHLKYDWQNLSSQGTAAKIKDYIKQNQNTNTSLKFKRHRYSNFNLFAGETFVQVVDSSEQSPGNIGHTTTTGNLPVMVLSFISPLQIFIGTIKKKLK